MEYMETDIRSIAILLTALLGLLGYLFNANIARKARLAEAENQRVHQQLVVQMERTNRWLDQCTRPLGQYLGTIAMCTGEFLYRSCLYLHQHAPETLAEMVALSGEDDPSELTQKYIDFWQQPWDQMLKGGLLAPGVQTIFCPFNADTSEKLKSDSLKVVLGFFKTYWGTSAYCTELPEGIYQVMAADTDSPLVRDYQQFVRLILVPNIQKIVSVLEEHGALMELPSTEWFQKTFPGHVANWENAANNIFFQEMYAYLNSWQVVLAEWDQGNLSRHRPEMLLLLPGLRQMVAWSTQRAQEKQQQLTGMSASMTTQSTINWQNLARQQQAPTVQVSGSSAG